MDNSKIRLFTSANSWIESKAIIQLEAVASLTGTVQVIAMPDLHPGRGIPVGAVTITCDVIYPHIIGNDIGCGIDLFTVECDTHHFSKDTVAKKLEKFSRECDRLSNHDSHNDPAFPSLGGGNHFAEFQAIGNVHDEEAFASTGIPRNGICLMVHCGSRSLGQLVYSRYIREHNAQNGLRSGSDLYRAYIRDHDEAVAFAAQNRSAIAHHLADRCALAIRDEAVIVTNHNSLESIETGGALLHLHRKGAAATGTKPVVIAGSRGSFSYIVQPVNQSIENGFSVAHGAGRKWGRNECRGRLDRKYTKESITRTKLGSRVVCPDLDLLFEEAPEAYKNINTVIDDLVQAGLVKVIAELRPLVTFKG